MASKKRQILGEIDLSEHHKEMQERAVAPLLSPKINPAGASSLIPSQSVGQVRGFLSEAQHKCFQRNSSKREVSKPSSIAALPICNSEKVFYLSGKTKRLPQLYPLCPHTETYGIGSFFKLRWDP